MNERQKSYQLPEVFLRTHRENKYIYIFIYKVVSVHLFDLAPISQPRRHASRQVCTGHN